MELGLSLGDTHEKSLSLIHKSNQMVLKDIDGLGFCMRLTPSSSITTEEIMMNSKRDDHGFKYLKTGSSSSSDPSVQLQLLHKPFPWLPQNQNFLNRTHAVATEEDPGTGSSSPDSSMMSSFRKEFAHVCKGDNHHHHHNHEIEADGEHINNSRGGSDEDENGALSRKKLRLTKDQSAFLEDSFKQHHTLNPKQKLALAKQLKLRPRQVEVWFQNRRARTKLKQTEVDCEYLKKCCETLREENKRLQKELQELRALKSCNPNFYMQLPATTLTMCPSCERLQAASTVTVAAATPPPLDHSKPLRLHTFLQDQTHALQASN